MPLVADTNLTSGEVSPTFLGRADQQRFPNAAQRIENYLLTITGMRSKRPGFGLMGFPKSTGLPIRLRRFQFSDQAGNMLEFGHQYCRVWASNGQVVSGSVPVEFPTSFNWDRLEFLHFTQSASFLFVIDEMSGIFTIQKYSATVWTFTSFTLQDGPYDKVNGDPNHTLTVESVGGPSTDTYVNSQGFAPWGAGDEGRLIRLRHPTNDADGNPDWRWLIIKSIEAPSRVVATWEEDGGAIAANQPISEFRLGLYSNRLGWPRTGKIHEQRLVLAGANSWPDRVDGSAIADYSNFAPTDPLVDNGAWGYTLGTDEVNRILTMLSSNDLLLLTAGREHHLAGDSNGAVITPTQVWQRPISPDGAHHVEAVAAGISAVFIDKYAQNVKTVTWDLRYANYAPDNITKLADHMYWQDPDSPGFRALAWQANPIPNIWTIRGNGELAGCVFEPRENVLGWHRHPMGMPLSDGSGGLEAAGPPPVVESIDILRGPLYDELWASVVRQLPSGQTLRTIERMHRSGLWDYPYQRQSFLDCSQQLFNEPAATLNVPAISGNSITFTVSGGTFTFTAQHVGQFIKVRYRKAMPGDAVPGYTLTGRSRFRMAIAQITTRLSATSVKVNIVRDFPHTGVYAAGTWGLTVSRITGLDHFEGLYVQVLSDGNVLPPVKVVAGAVDLLVPGYEINVGVNYTAIAVSMPLDPGPQPVLGQTRQTRLDSVVVRFLNSVGGEFASVPESDEERVRWERMPSYTQGGAAPSEPPQPTSDDKKINLAGEWSRRTAIATQQRDPLPHNVLFELNHVYAPFVQP